MSTRADLRNDIPEGLGRALRVVAVHAHPDDETLATGIALAHHALAGDEVHVITCTMGEEGEVITPALAHLEGSEQLGPHRRGEVSRATAALGVRHHWLGGDPPRWRDSGMAGSPASQHPRAFAAADPQEAGTVLADQLAQLAPDLVLTYDPEGGYGHPDHIQTHRVTVAALAHLASRQDPTTPQPQLYVALTPRSWAEEDRAWLAAHVPAGTRSPAGGLATVPDPEDPFAVSVVDDDLVPYAVSDQEALGRQVAALREHPTQVTVHDGWYTLSNDIAARLPGREGYARWEVAGG
ncbi:N-acetyl-1-D-myo-inositol-2-amino-2-deoxy-alpha-D-glucopyranoside deacetylase [Ornithinimicrobium sp. Y1847]|uniref:N-acetyl-1-D-myo-inositol-2-amino-2-deoxy-alpha- D-glucopyranoside deacetylase n=1 Tax=unclassified Ornithinimicrobium TaxID=2615080 RepID=UPI003B6764E3